MKNKKKLFGGEGIIVHTETNFRPHHSGRQREKEAVRHSHMSFSLMMPQKYCGFSTKLDRPESSSEEGGLVPKIMNRSDTANSSSVPKTDEPNERGRDANKQKVRAMQTPNQPPTICDCGRHQNEPFTIPYLAPSFRESTFTATNLVAHLLVPW